jgi:nicotinamide-nucleotide amidase
VFLGGVIAYDNAVKESLLGVPRADLVADGAVSESVACAMAEGARRAVSADIGIAITGVAGPDGGTPDKPVGTVWIAVAGPQEGGAPWARRTLFIGDREEVRFRATQSALDMVRRLLVQGPSGVQSAPTGDPYHPASTR